MTLASVNPKTYYKDMKLMGTKEERAIISQAVTVLRTDAKGIRRALKAQPDSYDHRDYQDYSDWVLQALRVTPGTTASTRIQFSLACQVLSLVEEI